MNDKDHLKYWENRYAKQGDNTVLHVSANHSAKAKLAIQQEWDQVEPRIEYVLMKALQMTPKQAPRLLDFGCGVGRWASLLSGTTAAGKHFNYLGVDIVEKAVRSAQGKYPNLIFAKYDLEDMLSFLVRGSIDLIFSCTVLQHITDGVLLERTVQEFKRILAPHGTLVLIENASAKPDLPHISFRGAFDYIERFPEVKFEPTRSFVLTNEVHLMYVGHNG